MYHGVICCHDSAIHIALCVLYFCNAVGSEATSCRQNAAECGRRIELSCYTICHWVASHCRRNTTKCLSGYLYCTYVDVRQHTSRVSHWVLDPTIGGVSIRVRWVYGLQSHFNTDQDECGELRKSCHNYPRRKFNMRVLAEAWQANLVEMMNIFLHPIKL